MNANRKTDPLGLIQSALFAALLCVISPLAIPVGPVPVTLGIFAVILTGAVLPWRKALAAAAIYILIGLVGLPVFSGGGSGFGVLLGPTGGYLWCYVPMAGIVSCFSKNFGWKRGLLGAVLATLLCYFTGIVQFALLANCSWREALTICVWPFIPFDILKLLAAVILGKRIRRRLQAAELL